MVAVWGGSRINLCFESLILCGGRDGEGGDASTSALQSSFVVLFRTGLKQVQNPPPWAQYVFFLGHSKLYVFFLRNCMCF